MLHTHQVFSPARIGIRLPAVIATAFVGSACSGPGPAPASSTLVSQTSPGDVALSRGPSDASNDTAGTDDRVIGGNRASLLLDGPETYDAMFDAMAAATDHINLETFILADDVIGRRLLETLAERVTQGVVVNVIYDAVGSMSTDDGFFERMRDRGINVEAYRPVTETEPWDLANRNHRKVLVVDGRVGFAGGLNFTEEYRFSPATTQGDARFGESWRDTHIRIEGPAVAALQRSFLAIWRDCSDAELAEATYYPELQPVGDQDVVIAATMGDAEGSHIVRHYLDAIRNATKRVWLTQAYFVPDDSIIDALRSAAMRGVDVRIILPAESDVDLTVPAGRSFYETLLDAGVRIYEFESAVLHAKTAVVDDRWSTVGSSNLDTMSIEFNNELNAIVLDEQFARQMMDSFRDDLAMSTEITAEEWADRGVWPRIKEAAARLLKPVL